MSDPPPHTLLRRTRIRRGLQWPVLCWLTAVWILLWGRISVLTVGSGVLVAFVILLVFPLPPLGFSGRIRPVGLALLAGYFLRDLVLASAQVAWLAIRPETPPRNAVIAVRLRSRADLYLMITAELVSLVPGSLLVETDHENHTLYLHILGTETPGDVERARRSAYAQEARVVSALASEQELREYRERVEGESP